MRCPKCGAFIEDGKDTCFMCGTNVNAFQTPTNNYNYQNNYMQQKEAYNNRMDDYRNVQITAKDGDKDVFDFFQEHKLLIRFVGLLLLIAILGTIGFKYYKSKTKAIEKKALLSNLYYDIDKELNLVDGNNEKYYNRSGTTGVECSIKITTGTSESNSQIDDYFNKILDDKVPDLNENGEVENPLDEYIYQRGTIAINGTTWSYINMFYKEKGTEGFTSLKYRYLSALHNGAYYNIELFNSGNDTKCTNSIDSFSRTLEFLDKEKGE